MAKRSQHTRQGRTTHRSLVAMGLFVVAVLAGIGLAIPGFHIALIAAAIAAAALMSYVLTRRVLLKRLHRIVTDTPADLMASGAAGDEFDFVLNAVSDLSHELRQSRQRLEDFTQSASDWLWEMDQDFRFVHVSERFYEASGLSPAEFLGRRQNLEAHRHPESDEWATHLEDLKAGRPFRNFTYAEPHPTGGERWFRLSGTPVFDETGRLSGYRGTGTDVSAEMMAREEAVDTTLRFLEAIETVSDGIAFWDSDDRFQLCN